MNVTISGGLGFIGLRLAKRFAERGETVTILDNCHPQVHANIDETLQSARSFANVVIGDVRDRAAWREVLRKCDVLLHMAAETGTGQSMEEILRYCETNVNGTAILAEELGRVSIQKVFLPSSRAIYGEGAYRCSSHGLVNGNPRLQKDLSAGQYEVRCAVCGTPAEAVATPERLPPSPASVYASTKLMQEQLLQQRCERQSIDLRVARYQNVYGPGQSLANPYTGVLAILSTMIAKGQRLDIFEDGKISRDFILIDDVVGLTLRLIDQDEPIRGAVNVGTGKPSSLIDVVHAYEDVVGRAIPFDVTGHFRYGDIRHAWADVSRLLNFAGPFQFTNLRDGLAQLWQWQQDGARAISGPEHRGFS